MRTPSTRIDYLGAARAVAVIGMALTHIAGFLSLQR